MRTWAFGGVALEAGGHRTTQGVVTVYVLQLSLSGGRRIMDFLDSGRYLTPIQAGSVHITGAVGERLILQAQDGTTFYFDVPGRCYVSSLTETAPAATPRPTRTPTPQPLPTGTPGPGAPYPSAPTSTPAAGQESASTPGAGIPYP